MTQSFSLTPHTGLGSSAQNNFSLEEWVILARDNIRKGIWSPQQAVEVLIQELSKEDRSDGKLNALLREQLEDDPSLQHLVKQLKIHAL